MNLPEIEVSFAGDAGDCDLEVEALARRCAEAATSVAQLKLKKGSELSILIAGDPTITELNRKWRNKDNPTNVLSFPGDSDGIMLGDIVVSLETTSREAELENKSLHDHFSHLVVHGFLHLFGYDHETEKEALVMERLETRILAELDIADPYKNHH